MFESYTDPLDCLTAHLMLECSRVLAGVKPANLISLVNRTRPCGRNLHQLWQQHDAERVKRRADLTFFVLKNGAQSVLLLCYSHDQLERHLAHAGIRAQLCKAGYEAGASCTALEQDYSKHPFFVNLMIMTINIRASNISRQHPTK